VDGITQALERLSRVIAKRMPKRARKLEDAMPELIAQHDALSEDFHKFYPELIVRAQQFGG
jgi:acyl carrier protein phosphodiesterase